MNAGDPEAFEVLYWRHRDWVFNLAFRLTGDQALALDVLQETFLYLLRKFPGFELRASLRTFLYPAVRNLSIAARRKAHRSQTDADGLEVLQNLSTTDPNPAGMEDLKAVLDGLPEEQREVLLLRFVDGLSLQEIAQAVVIPLGTVKSRLHNVLRVLREDPRIREFFSE